MKFARVMKVHTNRMLEVYEIFDVESSVKAFFYLKFSIVFLAIYYLRDAACHVIPILSAAIFGETEWGIGIHGDT